MLPIPLVLGLSLVLGLLSSAVPWLARTLPVRSLVIGLVVGIIMSLIGVVGALAFFPWADLGVLLVAWSGGLLLGRGIAPRFRPFLLWFLCLSVIDVVQITVGSHPGSQATGGPTPLLSGNVLNFLLVLPAGRFAINLVDILLITALAEHWRRRGQSYLIALLPSALGFLLADGFVLVTGVGLLPGIPFFTIGYLCTEGLYRYRSRYRGSSSAMTPQ